MNVRRMFGILGISAALACGNAVANGPEGRQELEGTWITGVAPSGATSFLGLSTYTQDGQVLSESSSTTIRSLDHGEWFKTGPRQYFRSSILFRFAEPHTYIGVSRITANIVLSENGDEYTAQAVTQRFDPNGNFVSETHNTEMARRCDSSTRIARCLGLGN
jgi:hypothetical protein